MYKGFNKNKLIHLTKLQYNNKNLIILCKKCNLVNNQFFDVNIKFIYCQYCNNPIMISHK